MYISMVSERKVANVVGAKTARACDNCIRKRARWYCAADDAFLCQWWDASVHSANPLARRHERVRLKHASIKIEDAPLDVSVPSWHRGFTKKARTPRHGKHGKPKFSEPVKNPLHLVPEICSEENSPEENEEQLLYRVPIFDPFVAELCTPVNSNEAGRNLGNYAEARDESRDIFSNCHHEMNRSHGLLPSEIELAEFAADVESLLGKGLDEESSGIEGLGLLSCKERDSMECSLIGEKMKVEDGEVDIMMGYQEENEIDTGREHFELKFDYDSSVMVSEEDNTVQVEEIVYRGNEEYERNDVKKKGNILLRLNYEGVLTAWADQRSPWTTGERPELDSNDWWPDCMGTFGVMHSYGEMGFVGANSAMVDGGREARVSRYREKRRTRLFSKKIRYEVRKLNAEKRPRMKGRFVKRANFAGAAFSLLNK